MKEYYINEIIKLLELKSHDTELMDLILKLLQKS